MVELMAFFNLTQLGPQNQFRTASNFLDDPAASTISCSGREQKPVGMESNGALHCCCKMEECTPPSAEAAINTIGDRDQTVTHHINNKVGKATEITTSTSKGRAELCTYHCIAPPTTVQDQDKVG